MQRFDDEIINGEVCPYCEAKSEYIDSSYIYGKSYGMVFICKPCDAYVGVHHKTSKRSLGRLANKELREWKKKAHEYFDKLWRKGLIEDRKKHEVRNAAYKWLSKELGIELKYCHIGMFDIEFCKKTIEKCKPYCK